MSLDEIRKKVSNGIHPFIIRASDGREHPVPHQEFIMVTRRSVVVADEKGLVDIINPLHITFLRETGDLPTET
jgi:hypothetical protein